MKTRKTGARVTEHLVQPFSIPYPGHGRTYLSSGFCEKDEITTIFKRSVVEGDSDVCSVECSVCGGPVITYKDSNLVTSTYSPEIVGCLIQKDKTLCFVLETELSPSDLKTVEGVILEYLARHDFTRYFQTISVYRSGVNSSLMKQVPPKRSLLYSQELKFISPKMPEDLPIEESLAPEVKAVQEKEDKKRREEMAASAKKLLEELDRLSMLPDVVKKEINSNRQRNSQKTSKRSQERLSKEEKISHRRSMKIFAMTDTVYD